jgi:hypothetical protein
VEDIHSELEDDSDGDESTLEDVSNGYQAKLKGILLTFLLQVSCSWSMHEITQMKPIQNKVVKMKVMDHN